MSISWRKGSTREWRQIRQKILTANNLTNGGKCRINIPGVCKGRADCVDHIHGKSVCPGCAADYPSHLQASCTPCNLKKGAPKQDPPARIASHWR